MSNPQNPRVQYGLTSHVDESGKLKITGTKDVDDDVTVFVVSGMGTTARQHFSVLVDHGNPVEFEQVLDLGAVTVEGRDFPEVGVADLGIVHHASKTRGAIDAEMARAAGVY